MQKNKFMLAVCGLKTSCLSGDYPRTCVEYGCLFDRVSI
jgi:hypothetical protein